MRQLNNFISSLFLIVIILMIITLNTEPQLHAKGIDVNVEGDLWITLEKRGFGDHLIHLDTETNVLSHYSLSQATGELQYHGFRNIIYDYALTEKLPKAKRSFEGYLKLLNKGGVAELPDLEPNDILVHAINYSLKNKKAGYQQWLKNHPDQGRVMQKRLADEPLAYIKAYLTIRFFKKYEKGEIRMMSIEANAVGNQRLFMADHTNHRYLVYELKLGFGLKLVSVRNAGPDARISEPDVFPVVFLHSANNISSAHLQNTMQKFENNRKKK